MAILKKCRKTFFRLFIFPIIITSAFILRMKMAEINRDYELLSKQSGHKNWSSNSSGHKYCYKENNTIIFLQVTNESNEWTPIEVCAFKSAALLHNDSGVCVLTKGEMKPHPALSELPNLEFSELVLGRLLEDTPLEKWNNDYLKKENKFPNYFAWDLSDGLRLAYLYKYGGKYMDTDSLTLRNLAPLQNVVGGKSPNLYNGVMFFEKGHPFIKQVLNAFSKNFKAGAYATGGPLLITLVHKSSLVDNLTYAVLEKDVFYPLLWTDLRKLYDPKEKQNVKSIINGSYAVHTWRFATNLYGLTHFIMAPPKGSFIEEFLGNNCSIGI